MAIKKVKWYCPRYKRYVENPNISAITLVGVTGQMSCDICGGWLMEIREKK